MGMSQEEKELLRQYEKEIERQRIQSEIEYKQALEYNERRRQQEYEYNERRNEILLENANKELDRARINFILKSHKAFGYNLNPYKMTRQQLEYWSNRLEREMKTFVNNNLHI